MHRPLIYLEKPVQGTQAQAGTLHSLQALRFVAALLVLLFHLLLAPSGYKGVDVFFVISGFVMYYTLCFRPRPTAFRFLANRLTKIFFLYWLALLLLFWIEPFSFDSGFAKTVLLLPGHHSVLGVSWSLSYELYFYLATGVSVFTLRKVFLRLYWVAFFVSAAFTIANLTAYNFKGSLANFMFGPNFWEYLLGLAAGFFATRLNVKRPHVFLPGMALLSFVVLLLISIPYGQPRSYLVYGLLSFLLVGSVAAFELRHAKKIRIGVMANWLGEASYGIYLFGPVLTILLKKYAASNLLIVLVTIGFSLSVNQAIERPFLRWSRKQLQRIQVNEKKP